MAGGFDRMAEAMRLAVIVPVLMLLGSSDAAEQANPQKFHVPADTERSVEARHRCGESRQGGPVVRGRPARGPGGSGPRHHPAGVSGLSRRGLVLALVCRGRRRGGRRPHAHPVRRGGLSGGRLAQRQARRLIRRRRDALRIRRHRFDPAGGREPPGRAGPESDRRAHRRLSSFAKPLTATESRPRRAARRSTVAGSSIRSSCGGSRRSILRTSSSGPT